MREDDELRQRGNHSQFRRSARRFRVVQPWRKDVATECTVIQQSRQRRKRLAEIDRMRRRALPAEREDAITLSSSAAAVKSQQHLLECRTVRFVILPVAEIRQKELANLSGRVFTQIRVELLPGSYVFE